MIYRLFISQICLSLFFVFTTMCGLYGIYGTSDRIYPRFYTKKDSELVDLVLEKINSMVFVLKDSNQEPIKEIDLSIFQENVHIFFPSQEKIPSIELSKYLNRFVKYAFQSPACYVVTLIYINRFVDKCGPNIFNQLSCYRIFLPAFVVAAKFFDDNYFSNSFYSKVGGVSRIHLNELEVQFLKVMDCNVFVSKEEYDNFLFVLGLNSKIDNFVFDLHRELDDFICAFKQMELGGPP